jgi:para-nitrobenzyl esterase
MLSRYRFTLIALLSAISGASTKTVTTTNGTIQGRKCNGYDASYYLAIPYAKPPVGDLRFASTEPYDEKYPGDVLQATSPAPKCIQFGDIFVESGTASEDW